MSYELRIGKLQVNKKGKMHEVKLPYTLKPFEYVACFSIEEIKMPSYIFALIVPNSYCLRYGIIVNAGRVDPTHNGRIVFGLFNASSTPIKIKEGDKFAHLLFSDVKGEPIPIENKYFGGMFK